MQEQPETENKIFKYAFLAAFSVLLIFVLWSVVFETLLPLYREKAYDEFVYSLIGIPLIIFGTGLFAYGGFIFVRETLRELTQNEKIAENLEIIKNKNYPPEKIKAARSENTKFLLATWKKGVFWLFLGAMLIITGGVITNLKNILG